MRHQGKFIIDPALRLSEAQGGWLQANLSRLCLTRPPSFLDHLNR
jgi:hypothetical protein